MYSLSYILPSILLLVLARKYCESRWGKCKNKVKLDNKVAIITGANSGIGYEIAKELASRNALVILACRTIEKASLACLDIKTNLLNNPNLIPMELDLTSLKSIQRFADEVKKNYGEIHLLINNAGVSYPRGERHETKDKFEIHFGVNYLGHFYLTNLLLEPLSASSSRVVIIASALHERGEINLDDLNGVKATRKINLYANSKLANIYFAQELAKRTKLRNIRVYACCPGWVYTGLFRHSFRRIHYIMLAPIAFFFMRSARQGAQTPIYCATEPELDNETGLIYRNCKHYNSKTIFYDFVAKKLWEQSEEMIQKALLES